MTPQMTPPPPTTAVAVPNRAAKRGKNPILRKEKRRYTIRRPRIAHIISMLYAIILAILCVDYFTA